MAFFAFNTQEYAVWIALTLYAYERGGTTTAGVLLVAMLVPAGLVAPFASSVSGRVRPDRALTYGYAVQALANLGCGLALWAAPTWLAYATAIVASCAVTLTRPVHHAILPSLAETPDELTAANSVSSSMEGLGVLVGPMLNSVLVAVSGPALVVLASAGVSLAGALVTFRLRLRDDAHPGVADPAEREGVIRTTAEGFRELRADGSAMLLTFLGGAQFVVLGMLDVFYVLLAVDVLTVGGRGAGLLGAAVGAGGLAGAAGSVVLVGRSRLTAPIGLAAAVGGAALAAVALVGVFGVVIAALILVGAGRAFFDIAIRTLTQRSVRGDMLARVFGLQEGLGMFGLALGSGAVPALVAAFGARGAFVPAGAFLPAAALLSLAALRSLDRRANVPDPERIALLRSLSIFLPLEQPSLERLARALQPVAVPAGGVVIEEGDPGDRFYVIVDGSALVRVGRRVVSRLSRGEPFGEIALLRDVPRTASVTAEMDLRLFALERDDFLEAVVGSRPSTLAAERLVEERLSGSPKPSR